MSDAVIDDTDAAGLDRLVAVIDELDLVESLLLPIYTRPNARLWMGAPHRSFGGESAVDLICTGRLQLVLDKIDNLVGDDV